MGSALHKQSKEHTAVIRLNGVIGGGYQDQVAMLRDGLEAAYANGKVKGIIIRANSPGGSPVISNTAFEEVRRLKAEHKDIPLYVVTEDMCASGCYYIAAAADKIYADPSSLVGSIGVIGGSFDFTELMDKIGVKRRLKTAGSNKGMGDPFSPETPRTAGYLAANAQRHTRRIHQSRQIGARQPPEGQRSRNIQRPRLHRLGSEEKRPDRRLRRSSSGRAWR